ncbi:MAG: peptidase S16 [Alphaproteobacteria bacterium]|nr:LON peptidase substrate-binding domain-containing protein [Alphaproteobacteria bacterium]TAD88228.1 MAG: peptidase S16 [Alphaproteobacteria bacterium]
MRTGPFDPRLEDLPATVPAFPLASVLLLPRGKLPLRIFEPRYLAMTTDALATPDRLIVMVQPVDPDSRAKVPEVYRTGCAGRIVSFSETDEGHYLLTLQGVMRVVLGDEIRTTRGYRRFSADWSVFGEDLKQGPVALDRQRLIIGLRQYFRLHGLSANWDAIEETEEERLITSLAMICPFEANEKQALLEATTVEERGRLLITLIEMALLQHKGGEAARH